MRRQPTCVLMLAALACLGAAPAPAFDAAAAWAEFAALIRTDYGYFQRPGVDGEAVLAAFRARAEATRDRAAFVDVLQLVAHNFADPHFVVGPFDDGDHGIVPTASDLHAVRNDGAALVVDVREGSEAAARGLRPGTRIVAIDGGPVDAAIAVVAGRAVADLSPVQADYCLDIALAGVWKRPRRLALAGPGGPVQRDLAPVSAQVRGVEALPPLTVEQRGAAAVIRINNSLGRNDTIAAFGEALGDVLASRVLVIDLRDTPSGGNTTVARGILGHFVDVARPYQVHVVPSEERRYGVPRRFVEYVLPLRPRFPGRVVVLGGHWTGSMGEGLMIGFDAIGAATAGSGLGDLLGALGTTILPLSGARVEFGDEQLFHVDGRPRESFVPQLYRAAAERQADDDPLLAAAIGAARRTGR